MDFVNRFNLWGDQIRLADLVDNSKTRDVLSIVVRLGSSPIFQREGQSVTASFYSEGKKAWQVEEDEIVI